MKGWYTTEHPAISVLLAQGEKTEYLFIIMKGWYTAEYPANNVLLAQREKTEYLFIIMKGKFTLPGTQLSIQLIVYC